MINFSVTMKDIHTEIRGMHVYRIRVRLGFPRIPNMRAYRRYPSAKYASVSAKNKLNMRAYMRKVCAMCILYAHIYARILCAYIRTHTLRIYTHAYLAHIYTRILCAYPRILCKHIRACYAPNAWSTSIYYARMCAIVHTLIWAQYIHAYPRIPSQIMH